MRNMKLIFSCLILLALTLSISAYADNGVERGSIDSSESQLPAPVKLYLEKLMFAHCDLKGAAAIRPSSLNFFSEVNDMGLISTHYKIELQVTYKGSAEVRSIHADLTLFRSQLGDNRVVLQELGSPLCNFM